MFDFSEVYISYVQSMLGGKIASGRRELQCRCKYCDDSAHLNHGHMYIKVPQHKCDISVFYCQKCHTSGIIDSSRLMEWGIYDSNIGGILDTIIKNAGKSGYRTGYERIIYNFNPYIIDNHELAMKKLKYINDRLGTNISLTQAMKEKIIFNVGEELYHNGIQQYTRSFNIIKQLNENFIGFLSYDNNFINLRRICEEGIVYESIDKRYVNYNIHDKKDNTEKFYISPAMIDLNSPERVKIHIAEGPFDILSIKYNLRHCEPGIYGAITGSGYKQLLLHLILNLKIFYFELHLYPDNDKFGNGDNMREIYEILSPLDPIIFIHRNTYPGEKDFGVQPYRINEVITNNYRYF